MFTWYCGKVSTAMAQDWTCCSTFVGADIRHLTGAQEFVAEAPVNLVLVADLARMQQVEPDEQLVLAAISAGCMSQNVALLCAAKGVASVPRALID